MNSTLMNFSSNQNETILDKQNYHSKLYWHEKYGNYFILDMLYISLFTPLAIIGFVLSVISLHIFSSKIFAKKCIYSYFRAYLVSSTIISFLFSVNFLHRSPSAFELSNTYTARYIGLTFSFPVFATFYYFNSILDVYISLERVTHFLPKLRIIRKLNPVFVCIFLFIFSLICNITYSQTYAPGEAIVYLDENTTYKIYFDKLTDFGHTAIGAINILAVYISRDVLTLILVIILNILSVTLMRRYLKARRMMFQVNEENITMMNAINTKLTNMVIAMSLMSSIEHSIFIITYLYWFISQDVKMSVIFNFISLTSIALKQIANFFIFLIFNRVFRYELKKLFHIS